MLCRVLVYASTCLILHARCCSINLRIHTLPICASAATHPTRHNPKGACRVGGCAGIHQRLGGCQAIQRLTRWRGGKSTEGDCAAAEGCVASCVHAFLVLSLLDSVLGRQVSLPVFCWLLWKAQQDQCVVCCVQCVLSSFLSCSVLDLLEAKSRPRSSRTLSGSDCHQKRPHSCEPSKHTT